MYVFDWTMIYSKFIDFLGNLSVGGRGYVHIVISNCLWYIMILTGYIATTVGLCVHDDFGWLLAHIKVGSIRV